MAVEPDMASRAVAHRTHGCRERGDGAVVVGDEEEIDGLGIFRRADDAQAVAGEGMRVEVQAHIHILPCGAAESLSGSLRGVDIESDAHAAMVAGHGSIHDAGTTLGLQQTIAHGAVVSLAIFPHRPLTVEGPRKRFGISGFEAVDRPTAFFEQRLPAAGEIMEIGLHNTAHLRLPECHRATCARHGGHARRAAGMPRGDDRHQEMSGGALSHLEGAQRLSMALCHDDGARRVALVAHHPPDVRLVAMVAGAQDVVEGGHTVFETDARRAAEGRRRQRFALEMHLDGTLQPVGGGGSDEDIERRIIVVVGTYAAAACLGREPQDVLITFLHFPREGIPVDV